VSLAAFIGIFLAAIGFFDVGHKAFTLALLLLGIGGALFDYGKAGILIRVGRAYQLEQSVRRYYQHLRQDHEHGLLADGGAENSRED